MFGIKGMHRSISYLRLMVVARQLIHGSGLGGANKTTEPENSKLAGTNATGPSSNVTFIAWRV
jgi:hypothetical protein